MGKHLIAPQIKTVIDSIKEGPKKWGELAKLKIGGKTIAPKSLDTILNHYLKYWGLVYKGEDDRWSWFLTKQEFENSLSYDMALEHTCFLLFGGVKPTRRGEQKRIGITADDGFFLDYATFNGRARHPEFFGHLRTGYPDVYTKFEKFSELLPIRGQIMKKNREMKLATGQGLSGLPSDYCNKRDSFPIPVIERTHMLKSQASPSPPPTVTKFEWSDWPVKDVEKLREIDNVLVGAMDYAKAQISIMFQQVQNKIPMKGYCDFCPHIKISVKSRMSQKSHNFGNKL